MSTPLDHKIFNLKWRLSQVKEAAAGMEHAIEKLVEAYENAKKEEVNG